MESHATVTLSSGLQSISPDMGRCQPPGVTTYFFAVSKDGKLYVKGVTDSNLEGQMFVVHGRFKRGDEAKALLAEGSDSIIPYSLTATSKVLLKAKTGSSLPAAIQKYAENPGQLGDILNTMSMAGLPKVGLYLHSCESETTGTEVAWTIKALEPACLKCSIEEPGDDPNTPFPPQEISFNKLSSYVVLSQLSLVQICFALEI